MQQTPTPPRVRLVASGGVDQSTTAYLITFQNKPFKSV